MPTQLYNNTNIYFICARNFTWEGKKYTMGTEWDQELAPGRLDALVRSRYLYPVVDSESDRPRHWHHHVHTRAVLDYKLGLTKELNQSSIATRVPQIEMDEQYDKKLYKKLTPWEETRDNGEMLKAKAIENFETEEVLREKNDENPEVPDPEQTEPEQLISDEEHTEKQDPPEERAVTEDDLFDPSKWGTTTVMDYLAGDISKDEFERVVAAERAGKARKGILNNV